VFQGIFAPVCFDRLVAVMGVRATFLVESCAGAQGDEVQGVESP